MISGPRQVYLGPYLVTSGIDYGKSLRIYYDEIGEALFPMAFVEGPSQVWIPNQGQIGVHLSNEKLAYRADITLPRITNEIDKFTTMFEKTLRIFHEKEIFFGVNWGLISYEH